MAPLLGRKKALKSLFYVLFAAMDRNHKQQMSSTASLDKFFYALTFSLSRAFLHIV